MRKLSTERTASRSGASLAASTAVASMAGVPFDRIAVRFPRMLRWREDKPVEEADTLQTLAALLPS